jgi:hypothetical protein
MTELWWLLGPIWDLIPTLLVAVGLAWFGLVLVRVRRTRDAWASIGSASLDVATATVIGMILLLTLLQEGGDNHALLIVPFAEVAIGRTASDVLPQYAGNVAMFVPLGLLVPVRWRLVDSLGRVVAASAAFSLAIEVTQWVATTGRQSSTTDVLMNTVGAAIGYGILSAIRSVGRILAPNNADA